MRDFIEKKLSITNELTQNAKKTQFLSSNTEYKNFIDFLTFVKENSHCGGKKPLDTDIRKKLKKKIPFLPSFDQIDEFYKKTYFRKRRKFFSFINEKND